MRMAATYVNVMYNTCYGGFSLSKAAVNEYKRKCPEAQDVSSYRILRHDPVMVGIVQRMGELANGRCAKVELCKIPVQYVDYYEIEEYDGMEHVEIQYDRFKLDAVKLVLKDEGLNESEKLSRISAVLKEDEEKVDTPITDKF